MIRIITMTILLALVGCSDTKTANYTVRNPTNGKHHAIFKTVELETKMECTAFAITDKYALTAAHCVKFSEFWIKNFKSKTLENTKNEIIKNNELMKKFTNCSPLFVMTCAAEISKLKVKNKQLLEKYNRYKAAKVSKLSVTNHLGIPTGVTATAHFRHFSRDYAILKGNFKNFNKLKVRWNFNVHKGDLLKVCGFPGFAVVPACSDLIAVGPMGFQYGTEGYIYKGMSGGPVIDHKDRVVGIISSIGSSTHDLKEDGSNFHKANRSLFEPIMGILDDRL